jgi:mannose-6-phosphate isomerase-like protein (cupin superfamily)
MIKYLRLEKQFDAAEMQRELSSLGEAFWKEHYNKNHYSGNWTILALRSINGDPDNVISVHASASINKIEYRNTPLLERCPYLQSVINFFDCEKTSARLMKLHAGAVIKEHTDHEMSFEEGEARFHIPVITNADVEFYLDKERIIMNEGECWYLNLSLKHRVNNFGSKDRIHLVIDCKVNQWIKDQFSGRVPEKKEIEHEERQTYSREEQLKIIENLKRMDTTVSKEMAEKMEREL